MTKVRNAILRLAVFLHRSRRARVVGLLVLLGLALLALTASGLVTAKEVTGPGNPVPAVPAEPYFGCDCAGAPGRFM